MLVCEQIKINSIALFFSSQSDIEEWLIKSTRQPTGEPSREPTSQPNGQPFRSHLVNLLDSLLVNQLANPQAGPPNSPLANKENLHNHMHFCTFLHVLSRT
jgi:hypothetical protein